MEGWPEERYNCPQEIVPYWNFRDELSILNDIIFKGTRIVIPLYLRQQMLKKIHQGHLGREKCKKRAREVLFWPNMNIDIDNLVANSDVCQKYRSMQQAEPLMPNKISSHPWERISIDLFSHDRKDYIVVVDSYSNYPEVLVLPNQTSHSIIQALKSVFSRHGIPQEVMNDNGPCYSSREFANFC